MRRNGKILYSKKERDEKETERNLQSLRRNMERCRREGKIEDAEFYQSFIDRHFAPATYILTCRNCQKNYKGLTGSAPESDAENNLIYCCQRCEEEDRKKEEFPFKNGICLQI